jgi:hypothetical protein
MNFVAPLWLAAAGLVAAGVVYAHLFTSTIPPQDVLPTVRFIPDSVPLTVLRSRRVSDWLLLALRLAVVALVGLALAGAHCARRAPPNVVIVDASRAVGSMSTVIDSALSASYPGGAFIVFDSSARVVSRDEVRTLKASAARGSLSAALVAAHRLVGNAEGMSAAQLVIVSPGVREEVDSAVVPLIDLWQGPLRVIRVAAATRPAASSWEIRAVGDDPVAAALAGRPNRRSNAGVRVLRGSPTRADSQWAVNSGGALVLWPADGGSLERRPVADTQGGVVTSHDVVVAPFVRAFRPREGMTLARWVDGEAAATERPLGLGCVREVAIPVDAVGDVALRESFRGIAASFIERCGGAVDVEVAAVPAPAWTRFGQQPAERTIPAAPTGAGKWPLWLGALAAAGLAIEQVLRRRTQAIA